ncbi:MAG: pyridine nucleotide-disulfide oxidoreductase [Desulfobulbaceae bacterium A2]|nr:MAG: pyridine nucleotide-disulfide oxidoreductase [Desulfobulbaceae bacterium A2]
MARKRLLLIGGGHAHLLTLARIPRFVRAGVEVTVIQPSVYHYYSGMAAGMLGGLYSPEEIRFATRATVEQGGGVFVIGKAERIDAQRQEVLLEDGRRLGYDVLSCNAGSSVPQGAYPSRAVFPADVGVPQVVAVKPIENLLLARQQVLQLGRERCLKLVVAGGGPSALELCGNLWRLGRTAEGMQPLRITLCAGRALLPRVPERVRRLARTSLLRRGIDIREHFRCKSIGQQAILAEDGACLPADLVILAIGVRPSPIFARSGLPCGPDGGLTVNAFLQCPSWSNIFGGGDCVDFQPQALDKVGVYAVRQNPVLAENLMAACCGSPLQPFHPGGRYLLIYNLGDGCGIFHRGNLIFGGPLAFRLKDWIDRRFMRRFQRMTLSVSG